MNPIIVRFVYDVIVKTDDKSKTANLINQAIEKNPTISFGSLNNLISADNYLKNTLSIDFKKEVEFNEVRVISFKQEFEGIFDWELKARLLSPIFTCINILPTSTAVCHKADDVEIQFIPLGDLKMIIENKK